MKLASSTTTLSFNQRNALIVRVGEKRILDIYLQRTHGLLTDWKVLEESEKGKRTTTRKNGGRRHSGLDRIPLEP
jgi:hypothetical protein